MGLNLFSILLVVHITGGSLSLLLGSYILITTKGTTLHKRVGKMFYYSMLIAAMVAIPMTYLHPNGFLFLISVFTVYMLLTGIRSIHKRDISSINIWDWFLTILMIFFGFAFLIYGVLYLINGNGFGIVYIAFGIIGILFSYIDYINFMGKSRYRNFYLMTHIQRMTGSYIASFTAFLVVNNRFLPDILAWLLPTIILLPFIVKWSRSRKVLKTNELKT
ncbi:MAG TPA: hypothetical protein PKC30_09785 [Saprospiraceae bacterium]|nr:hypothetical protein [Saprospiraceae bacterium]